MYDREFLLVTSANDVDAIVGLADSRGRLLRAYLTDNFHIKPVYFPYPAVRIWFKLNIIQNPLPEPAEIIRREMQR